MEITEPMLLSGNEALALGALHAGLTLGVGYPGTPSTEILESLSSLGGRAQWSPNEKVAAEVGLGVAYAGGRTLVTMKHVGFNVAADTIYTTAYSGVQGGYVIACADDPGMASSQNEQDTRRHAHSAGIPLLEPSDSQECYDLVRQAFEISERWGIPVILRVTTRICHSYSTVNPSAPIPAKAGNYEKLAQKRVMIPAHARPAHKELRRKLREIAAWNDQEQSMKVEIEGGDDLGIITSGISFQHACEAFPDASILKLNMSHPLPEKSVRDFASKHKKVQILEENDPYLFEQLSALPIPVINKPESFRFGEFNVTRVRDLISIGSEIEPPRPKGKPPALCNGCPHRNTFEVLKAKDCIVAGDIGCYTLSVLPPLEAMDTQNCMGASIGVGLGMRHTLPEAKARRVVSVIGDSTFMHSGMTGIAEMVYSPPTTGHVVVILDNSTTAMTGLQEHPATGRTLNHDRSYKIELEAVCKALGVDRVEVVHPGREKTRFESLLEEALASNDTTVLIARQPCILAAPKIRKYEQALQRCECEQ